MCLTVRIESRDALIARFARSRNDYLIVEKTLKSHGMYGHLRYRRLRSRHMWHFWSEGWNWAETPLATYDQRVALPRKRLAMFPISDSKKLAGPYRDGHEINGGALHAIWLRVRARPSLLANVFTIRLRAYREDLIDAGVTDACFTRLYLPREEYRRGRRWLMQMARVERRLER